MNLNKIFPRLPIRRKLMIGFLGMGFLPLLAGGVVGVLITIKLLRKQVVSSLELKAHLTASDIESYAVRIRGLTAYLSELPDLKAYLAAPSDAKRHRVEEAFAAFARLDPSIHQVRFLDKTGWEVIRINVLGEHPEVVPRKNLQLKADRYYFQEALRAVEGKVYVSPFDYNIEWGKIEEPRRTVVRFAKPVPGPDGTTAGVVVINVLGDFVLGFVHRLTEHAPSDLRAVLVDSNGTRLSHEHSAGKPDCTIGLATAEFAGGDDVADRAAGARWFPPWGSLSVQTPVRVANEVSSSPRWSVVLSHDPDWAKSVAFPLLGALAGASIVLVPLVVWVAWLGAGQLTSPLLQLRRQAKELADGNFSARARVESNDEIEDLAEEFNRTAERLERLYRELERSNSTLQEEVERRTREAIQAEKMAAAGVLAAGIVHEVANPLAAMKTVTQAILTAPKDEEAKRRSLERLLGEIRKLESFVRTFNSFASPAKDAPGWCDASEAVTETLQLFCPEAERHGIHVHRPPNPPRCSVQVGPRTLQQILMHLLVNSLQAMPEGGTIRIGTTQTDGRVRLEVEDSGAGIGPEDQKKVFDPFFTTKPGGTGLGLSIVYRTVREHGGDIRLHSEPGEGATFTLEFPIHST